jgi:poly(ADP-ribose) glycohydrolase ARH3
MGADNLSMDLARIDSLSYTDDTAMAIGLAQALVAQGRVHEQQLGDGLRQIYRRARGPGYRLGSPMVFALVEGQGLSYRQAAARLGHAAGALDSGAATRMTLVGLFFADAPDLYEQAALSAAVTHMHPVAIDGAAVLAKAIAQVVPLSPATPFAWQSWLHELLAFARTGALRKQLQMAEEMFASQVTPQVAFTYLGRGSTMQTVLPFALYAFLWHSTSFQRCLLCAVTHGGAHDALGAMAGALAGAYLGIEAIPKEWQAKLENRCVLEHLACTLAAKAALP